MIGQVEEKTITAESGKKIAYLRWIPSSRNTSQRVLMFHSVFFDKHLWDDLARYACSELGMEVFCLDMVGHGESSKDISDASYDSIYRDFLNVVESLLLAPFHYVGCSIGCEWGLRMAVSHPEFVQSLVLAAPLAFNPSPQDRYRIEALINNWRDGGVASLVNFMFSKPFFFAKQFLSDIKMAARREQEFTRISSLDPAALEVMALLPNFQVVVDYSRVKAPTLIMCGADDVFFLPHMEHLNKLTPHSTACLVPHAAHVTPIENPEVVIKASCKLWRTLL